MNSSHIKIRLINKKILKYFYNLIEPLLEMCLTMTWKIKMNNLN